MSHLSGQAGSSLVKGMMNYFQGHGGKVTVNAKNVILAAGGYLEANETVK